METALYLVKVKLLSMVFQFEIANLDHGLAYRHLAKTWKLSEMKKSSWQTELEILVCRWRIERPIDFDRGSRDRLSASRRCRQRVAGILQGISSSRSTSMFWPGAGRQDRGPGASDTPEFRVQSAKMLAIYMLTLTGTSFIVSTLIASSEGVY
jgi:hypothetical protein